MLGEVQRRISRRTMPETQDAVQRQVDQQQQQNGIEKAHRQDDVPALEFGGSTGPALTRLSNGEPRFVSIKCGARQVSSASRVRQNIGHG